VAPDGHVADVHVHVRNERHGVVHLVVVTNVDAASRRHNASLSSIRKEVAFASSVNEPGIGPVNLLAFMALFN
jgi:hypothetical protein